MVASNLRWPTVVALLLAGGAHIPVTPEHLREAPYMGAMFVAFTVVAVAVAIAVALRGSASAPFVAAGIISAAAIGTYCLTRLVALPQMSDDLGNWGETAGVIAIASEAVVVALSATTLSLRSR